jgi:hypothetical protein
MGDRHGVVAIRPGGRAEAASTRHTESCNPGEKPARAFRNSDVPGLVMIEGRETIQAEVRQGTRRDAVLLAAGANNGHGLRRTNEDNRRAVEHLLRDAEWVLWSNEEIARKCGVSSPTVASIRKELESRGDIESKTFRFCASGEARNLSRVGRQPSANGHASPPSDAEPADDDDDDTPATEPTPASPPMAPPNVVDHRVSIMLDGGADAGELARLHPVQDVRPIAGDAGGEVLGCVPSR